VAGEIFDSGQVLRTAWRVEAVKSKKEVCLSAFISADKRCYFGYVDQSAVVGGPKIGYSEGGQLHFTLLPQNKSYLY
jgi:hypothetical protein